MILLCSDVLFYQSILYRHLIVAPQFFLQDVSSVSVRMSLLICHIPYKPKNREFLDYDGKLELGWRALGWVGTSDDVIKK